MPSLETLPCEIKDQICSHLCQMDLYNLISISPELSNPALTNLYRSPNFYSSYRFAQFVTTVSHSRRFADMVRRLIVWDTIEEESGLWNLARWIEWTYREQPVYATGDPPSTRPFGSYGEICWDKHPTRSKFLGGDYGAVPIGLIIQVLSSCKNLRVVHLSAKWLYKDCLLTSSFHPPTTISGKLFLSELPRSWSPNGQDVVQVKPDAILAELLTLRYLEKLGIRNVDWLTTEDVGNFLASCPRLQHVDFRGSGPIVEAGPRQGSLMSWATKGDKDEVASLLQKSAQ